MARIYRFTLGIGLAGCRQEEEVDIPDLLGMTDDEWDLLPIFAKEQELEEAWQGWRDNFLDGGYHEVES